MFEESGSVEEEVESPAAGVGTECKVEKVEVGADRSVSEGARVFGRGWDGRAFGSWFVVDIGQQLRVLYRCGRGGQVGKGKREAVNFGVEGFGRRIVLLEYVPKLLSLVKEIFYFCFIYR